MSKRITIKDIAKSLNIHHSTVSRALRNEKGINEKTCKKVIDFANEKGYKINLNAIHMRGGGSNVIGVLVPNINHSFFSNSISYITNLAFDKGYCTAVFQSNESIIHEKQIVDVIIKNNLAGVIASVSMETRSAEHFLPLSKLKIPLVMFDRVPDDFLNNKIVLDNYSALYETVDVLLSKGCKNMVYASGDSHVALFRDRQEGFINKINTHAYISGDCRVVKGGFTVRNGKYLVEQLFNRDIHPDAIICDSHLLMQGVLSELENRNIKVSVDVCLASFGSYEGADIIHPEVIQIKQPEKEMSTAAFNALYTLMNREDDRNLNAIFKAKIINNKH